MSKENPETDFETTSQKFGRYKILEHLAKGGMAQIYKAETPNGKIFTLKKILSDYSNNPEFIKMFLEEAKISLQLKSPHIVRVLDFGQVEGFYFLAMEYVFGKDLGTLLRTCVEKRVYLPIDIACFIVLQCARGLDYAHSLKDDFGKTSTIIHRDISPPNLLLSYNGEAKILDFGIAKAQKSSNRRNTRSGVLKGKFSYMSPEQASGQPLTGSSDLFSLGIVFHELLTCRSLFYSRDEMETLERVRKADVPSPRKFRQEIPVALEKIVMKSLGRKPKSRFQSCGEFAEAIKDFLKQNYPRTDSRTVARFIRSIFPDDFQKRSHSAAHEGWIDILVAGGADEDLLLDKTFSEEVAQRNLKSVKKEELSAWQRALYDPRLNKKIILFSQKVLMVAALVGLAFLGWASGWIQRTPELSQQLLQHVLNFQWTNPSLKDSSSASETSTAQSAPQPTQEALPFGGFAYWKQKADEAEAESRWEEADVALRRALEINPFDSALQIRREFVQLYQGNLKAGCQFFQSHQELSAEDRLLALSVCAEGKGDWVKAASGYQDFLKLYPKDSRASKVSWALKHLRARIKE